MTKIANSVTNVIINTIFRIAIKIDVRSLKTYEVFILSMLVMNVTAMNWFGTAAKQLIKAHMAGGLFSWNSWFL